MLLPSYHKGHEGLHKEHKGHVISASTKALLGSLPHHIVCRPGCDVVISVAVVKIHFQHRIFVIFSKIPRVVCAVGAVYV